MTQYTKKSFSVNMAQNSTYRDNYDRAFGKGSEQPAPESETSPEPLDMTNWEPCAVCGRGHFCPGAKK